jgi:pimeloyl-ACP methyl ester carboxylesterase
MPTSYQENCQVSSMTLVGHSMGGYVARLTPIRHPSIAVLVPSIITLATPHHNPLYAFDKSVHDVHQQIQQQTRNNSTLIVSISGGVRDEMIAPSACNAANQNAASFSVRGRRACNEN